MIVSTYRGPRPMRDKGGRVVVQFGQFPDCPELAPNFTVSVIGWGSQLVAEGTDLDELAAYARRRFGDLRIARGETLNPGGLAEAVW